MLFLGVVMMPFYYISRTHSVPGYLKLRYGESAQALSAVSFGLMTVFMSGINMYSMALVMKIILGWDIHFSIWMSSLTVAAYVFLGGLLSAIFNEVLQFFLIWLGAIVISILGLIEAGGWSGMVRRIAIRFPGQEFTHLRAGLGSVSDNPMGIHWTGIVLGLGFVISFGYWTTDFLSSACSRRRTCGVQKQRRSSGRLSRCSSLDCDRARVACTGGPARKAGGGIAGGAWITQLQRSAPDNAGALLRSRIIGLGITALIAGFMSGMAGNVSAFATVWTYDIYRAFIRKAATDSHYVAVGRWCTVFGVLVSIGTAYLVMQFASIMDYVQALFSFFIAPLFGTVILGMLWKRTTPAAGFWGLLAGTVSSIGMFVCPAQSGCSALHCHLAPGERHGGEHVSRSMELCYQAEARI